MKRFALQTALALALLCGCRSTPPMNQTQAIALAKAEACKKGWKDLEVESASQEDGIWRVTIWRLPKVPGGHATVEVSKDGKIVGFVPGR